MSVKDNVVFVFFERLQSYSRLNYSSKTGLVSLSPLPDVVLAQTGGIKPRFREGSVFELSHTLARQMLKHVEYQGKSDVVLAQTDGIKPRFREGSVFELSHTRQVWALLSLHICKVSYFQHLFSVSGDS